MSTDAAIEAAAKALYARAIYDGPAGKPPFEELPAYVAEAFRANARAAVAAFYEERREAREAYCSLRGGVER